MKEVRRRTQCPPRSPRKVGTNHQAECYSSVVSLIIILVSYYSIIRLKVQSSELTFMLSCLDASLMACMKKGNLPRIMIRTNILAAIISGTAALICLWNITGGNALLNVIPYMCSVAVLRKIMYIVYHYENI